MTTKTKYVDWGGLTPIVNGIRVNATKPGQLGSELTATEIEYLDGITPGTVAAEKAVVVDENSDVGDFNILSTAVLNITDTDNLEDPGDNGAGTVAFDKMVRITVDGTDYWIGVYDDNETT